jgi:hypothetical protein
MTLSNKSQILGVHYTSDSSAVKVAYNDGGTLKRVNAPINNAHVTGWVNDGNTIKDYKEPNDLTSHATPTVTG